MEQEYLHMLNLVKELEFGLAVEVHPDDMSMVRKDLDKVKRQHGIEGINIYVSPDKKALWICKELKDKL